MRVLHSDEYTFQRNERVLDFVLTVCFVLGAALICLAFAGAPLRALLSWIKLLWERGR